jgi:hypothetical protein
VSITTSSILAIAGRRGKIAQQVAEIRAKIAMVEAQISALAAEDAELALTEKVMERFDAVPGEELTNSPWWW